MSRDGPDFIDAEYAHTGMEEGWLTRDRYFISENVVVWVYKQRAPP